MTRSATIPARPDVADLDFLRRLHRRESGTVQELCEDLSVTATAVRNRLTRLVSAGYVAKRLVREGRGRPRHDYSLTERGLRELGDNYSELAAVLWDELRRIQDPGIRNRLLSRIQVTLAERYAQGIDGETLSDRIEQFGRRLCESGLDVEIDVSGELPVLRENSCPYYDLASTDTDICELEQRVFEQALGTRMELTHRCIEGHSCCTFEIRENPRIGESIAEHASGKSAAFGEGDAEST